VFVLCFKQAGGLIPEWQMINEVILSLRYWQTTFR